MTTPSPEAGRRPERMPLDSAFCLAISAALAFLSAVSFKELSWLVNSLFRCSSFCTCELVSLISRVSSSSLIVSYVEFVLLS